MVSSAFCGKLVSISIICLLVVESYLSIGALGVAITPQPVSILHYDSTGARVAATANTFSSGENIWLQLPTSSMSPYWVTVRDVGTGNLVLNTTITTFSPTYLLHVILSPSWFPAGSTYHLALTVTTQPSPGIIRLVPYAADIIVSPSVGQLSFGGSSQTNGLFKTNVTLLDYNHNPLTGVKVGLILHQGNASIRIASSFSETDGSLSFDYGQAIASGRYGLETAVLDTGSVNAASLQVGTLNVPEISTSMTLKAKGSSQTTATLQEVLSTKPVAGRLLLLEQQVVDGNWTIIGRSYTGSNGQAVFNNPSTPRQWRIIFKGDEFYGAAWTS